MPPGALILIHALSPSHLLTVMWASAHSKALSLSDRGHIRPLHRPQGQGWPSCPDSHGDSSLEPPEHCRYQTTDNQDCCGHDMIAFS